MTPPQSPERQSPPDGNSDLLSAEVLEERMQKEIREILIQRYGEEHKHFSAMEESFRGVINSNERMEKPDRDFQNVMEFQRYQAELQRWEVALRLWLAQGSAIQESSVPSHIRESDRRNIVQSAKTVFEKHRDFITRTLRERCMGKSLSAQQVQTIFQSFRRDLLLWRVDENIRVDEQKKIQSQQTKDALASWEILARAKHFSEVFHYDPSDKGKLCYTRIFHDGRVTKRVTFVPPPPIVMFAAGNAFEFKIQTIDNGDSAKIISTDTLTVPFASADQTSNEQWWLIRNLLATPLEYNALQSIFNVTNFFRFSGNNRKEVEITAQFPFDIKKIYEDKKVTNRKYFLERLLDMLWWWQGDDGVTAKDCTFILQWFKNNITLFGQGVDTEAFDAGDRALGQGELRAWPDERGEYMLTDDSGNTMVVAYRGGKWQWRVPSGKKYRHGSKEGFPDDMPWRDVDNVKLFAFARIPYASTPEGGWLNLSYRHTEALWKLLNALPFDERMLWIASNKAGSEQKEVFEKGVRFLRKDGFIFLGRDSVFVKFLPLDDPPYVVAFQCTKESGWRWSYLLHRAGEYDKSADRVVGGARPSIIGKWYPLSQFPAVVTEKVFRGTTVSLEKKEHPEYKRGEFKKYIDGLKEAVK